jgi:hypothetical protein
VPIISLFRSLTSVICSQQKVVSVQSELLSRSKSSDFIRLEGLQKLTNVTAHDWDLYILL